MGSSMDFHHVVVPQPSCVDNIQIHAHHTVLWTDRHKRGLAIRVVLNTKAVEVVPTMGETGR